MPFLRSASLLALGSSALLTADRLHPGRAFCPLAAACEKARESALGTWAGVPTSALGLVAFGGLFLLTFLPLSMSRRALRPAGVVAGVTGATLILYQAFVIGSFCPFCLVADVAGLAAAGSVLGWRPPPIRRSGRPLPPEPLDLKLRWATLAAIVVALPFLWPRDERPSWVPLARTNPLLAESAPPPPPAPAAQEGPRRPPLPAALAPIPPLARDAAGRVLLPSPAAATATPLLAAQAAPADRQGAPPDADGSPPWATFTPRGTCPEPTVSGAPQPPPPPPPPSAPRSASAGPTAPPSAPATPRHAPPTPADARPQVGIVEYVNAFCPHCRVTHRRLSRVLASLGVAARVRRVYTWPGDEVPAWARACAFAEALGLEDRTFEELLAAPSDDLGEILAAGRRAGLDAAALRSALAAGAPAPRLERDRRIAGSAGLEGLPTLDIGRRRLLGEQSEDELREAIEAALALRPSAR